MVTIILKMDIENDVGVKEARDVVIAEGSTVNDFYFENAINTRPFGNFTVIDSDHLFINTFGLRSDVEGTLVFQDSLRTIGDSDGEESSSASIDFIVTGWEQVAVNGIDTNIRFTFLAGRFADEVNLTSADTGNSIDAMSSILRSRGARFELGSTKLSRLSGTNVSALRTVDTPAQGAWYNFNTNMFDALNYVVNHSLKFNDYLYWVYDDVSGKYIISSIVERASISDRYVFMWTGNTAYDQMATSPDTELKIVMPMGYTVRSEHGQNYANIFPNVTYTIGFDTDVKSTMIDFSEYMKNVRGNDIEFGGGSSVNFGALMNIDRPTYGAHEVKQMSSLNTHKLHAFAEDYRKFKYATFSKKLDVYVENTFGFPLGEYVTFLNHEVNNMERGTLSIEEIYSDRYIIEKKVVRYEGNSDSLRTTMTLMSDNDGISDDIRATYDAVKTVLMDR